MQCPKHFPWTSFDFFAHPFEAPLHCCRPKGSKSKADYREDADVSLERQRVVTGDVRGDILVLRNLTKKYRRGWRKITAVRDLCVGIPKGEVSFCARSLNGLPSVSQDSDSCVQEAMATK